MRKIVHAVFMNAALLLAACGGGESPAPAPTPTPGPTIASFTADASVYYVGEQARLTVVFSNGTGRLQPDDIPVTSGQTITTEALTVPIQYRLVVSDGTTSVSRTLDLQVRYRDRVRAVAMPFARGEHRAVKLGDGRVLVIGGEDDGHVFPYEVPAFDPATETFVPFAQLSSGRVAHMAIPLYSGEVLVAGGIIAQTGTPRAETIHPTTGVVTATANSPARHRSWAAATLTMDGQALICGGLVGAVRDDTVEIYDPETRRFSLLPGKLQVARLQHTVVRIDANRFLVYGGNTADLQPAPPEIYDMVSGNSTVLPLPESTARGNHAAITLQDGGILIIGGEDQDQQPLSEVLRFDPATSTFSRYATLALARSGPAVNRLVDGRVIIAGGIAGMASSDSTDTIELLTDRAQRQDGPRMGVARREHTITRLDSGKLLIIGGLRPDGWPLASAEIYE